MDRVFVYGILMRDAREGAVLPDHRLAFDGFATVEECIGDRVLGGVVEVDDLRRYDGIEGVDPRNPSSTDGFYRRVPVRLADGSYAWVYKMNRRRGFARPPHEGLLDEMRHQYDRLGHEVEDSPCIAAPPLRYLDVP